MASDIAQWLADLELSKYLKVFDDNEVGWRDLPHITDSDLKELGLPLGPRRRLIAAIEGLSDELSAAAETSAPDEKPAAEAERRQVTVLFADISGFTAFAEEQGAEGTHRLLNEFFAVADAAVLRFGGTVDKHIGDAVMAVFGAPIAHTDDPLRAARTALELHQVTTSLSPPLDIHIGIASGQVVASRMGSAAHTEYTVTGESVNLASRLTDLAGPGQTLVSAAVVNSVVDQIAAASLGSRMIEGLPEPIDVWRLDGIREDAAIETTPFVGRQPEKQQFEEIVGRCLEHGQGELILVRGEAGIGKTRLVQEFERLAVARGFACSTGLVLDFGTGKGEGAISALVRGLLNLKPDTDEQTRFAAVNRAITAELVTEERRIHLNDLLELAQPEPMQAILRAMDNETRSRGQRDTAIELVVNRSRVEPLLLRIEDLHWADAATLDSAGILARAMATCPAILVLTTRITGDPFDDDWVSKAGNTGLTRLDIKALDDEEAASLARDFTDVEEGIVATCVARAAGNPLFLEQLLRNVGELAEGNVPGTIQGIVQARLDAIPARDRRALQAASVLGQRFSLAAVCALAGFDDYQPDRLLANALIRPVDGDYLFGHALIRDGTYASLLTERRTALHSRAASWFAERDALLYASHLDRADDTGAAEAYVKAGRELAARFRYDDALAAAERGVEIVGDTAQRFDLQQLRGDVLRDAGNTDASIEAFEAALAAAPDGPARCRALIGIAACQRVLGQADEALSNLAKAEPLARADDLALELARIHHLRGNIGFLKGDVELCRAEQQQALIHARAASSAEIEAQALTGLGDSYYMQGRMISSYENFSQAAELARDHDLLAVYAGCVPGIAHMLMFQNQLSAARSVVKDGLKVIQQVGHLRAETIVRLNFAALLCEFLDAEAGLAEVEMSLGAGRQIGAQVWEPLTWTVRGRCLFHLSDRDGAVAAARQGAALARETSRALLGPWSLGVLAWVTDDDGERRSVLAEGEEMLTEPVVGHCHLWFYRDAIEACLDAGDADRAIGLCGALEAFTAAQPLPWSDFFIARGRALAAHAGNPRDGDVRDRLTALREAAAAANLGTALPAIERALAH